MSASSPAKGRSSKTAKRKPSESESDDEPKRAASSSDSDIDPPSPSPPKKKASLPQKKAKSSSKADEDEPSWDLGSKKFIKVREFGGRLLIDIREFYLDNNTGELKPGKKGISLNLIQFQKLKEVIDEVETAVKQKS